MLWRAVCCGCAAARALHACSRTLSEHACRSAVPPVSSREGMGSSSEATTSSSDSGPSSYSSSNGSCPGRGHGQGQEDEDGSPVAHWLTEDKLDLHSPRLQRRCVWLLFMPAALACFVIGTMPAKLSRQEHSMCTCAGRMAAVMLRQGSLSGVAWTNALHSAAPAARATPQPGRVARLMSGPEPARQQTLTLNGTARGSRPLVPGCTSHQVQPQSSCWRPGLSAASISQ